MNDDLEAKSTDELVAMLCDVLPLTPDDVQKRAAR